MFVNKLSNSLICSICCMLLLGLSSCSEKKLSDSKVIDNFVAYVGKNGREKNISIIGRDENALCIHKNSPGKKTDNQVVILGYDKDALDTFREALLEEFFSDKDSRLMKALINKDMSLQVVYGNDICITVEFTPDDLSAYKRNKK